jgi:uroporphyrinogen-III synthase
MQLAVLGATVQHVPAIERRAVPHAPISWDDATAILLTSPATLRFLQADTLPPNKCIVACAGNRTAEAAISIGLTPSIVGAGSSVLCIEMLSLCSDDLVCFPGPVHPIPATLEALRSTGARVRHIPVYETTSPAELPIQVSDLAPFDLLVFASPSAVVHWTEAGGPVGRVVSIGPTTTLTARRLGFSEVVNAEVANTEGIVQRIIGWAGTN